MALVVALVALSPGCMTYYVTQNLPTMRTKTTVRTKATLETIEYAVFSGHELVFDVKITPESEHEAAPTHREVRVPARGRPLDQWGMPLAEGERLLVVAAPEDARLGGVARVKGAGGRLSDPIPITADLCAGATVVAWRCSGSDRADLQVFPAVKQPIPADGPFVDVENPADRAVVMVHDTPYDVTSAGRVVAKGFRIAATFVVAPVAFALDVVCAPVELILFLNGLQAIAGAGSHTGGGR